jgi:hypothetical protein
VVVCLMHTFLCIPPPPGYGGAAVIIARSYLKDDGYDLDFVPKPRPDIGFDGVELVLSKLTEAAPRQGRIAPLHFFGLHLHLHTHHRHPSPLHHHVQSFQ